MRLAIALVLAAVALAPSGNVLALEFGDVCDKHPTEISSEKRTDATATLVKMLEKVAAQIDAADQAGASGYKLYRLGKTMDALICLIAKSAVERGVDLGWVKLKGTFRVLNKETTEAGVLGEANLAGGCWRTCVAMSLKRWCSLSEPDDLMGPGGMSAVLHEGIHLGQTVNEPDSPLPPFRLDPNLSDEDKVACLEFHRELYAAASELDALGYQIEAFCAMNEVLDDVLPGGGDPIKRAEANKAELKIMCEYFDSNLEDANGVLDLMRHGCNLTAAEVSSIEASLASLESQFLAAKAVAETK